MEITTTIELTKQELWDLIESLPESKKSLSDKLKAARGAFERRYPVYGNGAKIKPRALDGLQRKLETGD